MRETHDFLTGAGHLRAFPSGKRRVNQRNNNGVIARALARGNPLVITGLNSDILHLSGGFPRSLIRSLGMTTNNHQLPTTNYTKEE